MVVSHLNSNLIIRNSKIGLTLLDLSIFLSLVYSKIECCRKQFYILQDCLCQHHFKKEVQLYWDFALLHAFTNVGKLTFLWKWKAEMRGPHWASFRSRLGINKTSYAHLKIRIAESVPELQKGNLKQYNLFHDKVPLLK